MRMSLPTSRSAPLPRPPKFTVVTDSDPSRAIIEQVRAKLQKGQLVEGDRLPPEREFAEQLGVSRNTVRKAISGLAQLGLVVVRKGANGGAFVAQHSGLTIRAAMADMFHLGSVRSAELTEARLVLGQAVVRLACERSTPSDFEALERNVDAAEKAIAEGDIASRISLNIDFYRLLALAAKNEVLTVLMDAIGQSILQFVRTAGLVSPDAIMPIRRTIIDALRRRDADAAVAALTNHLTQLDKHYRRTLESTTARETRRKG